MSDLSKRYESFTQSICTQVIAWGTVNHVSVKAILNIIGHALILCSEDDEIACADYRSCSYGALIRQYDNEYLASLIVSLIKEFQNTDIRKEEFIETLNSEVVLPSSDKQKKNNDERRPENE
jgi:hypothetical protein